VRKSTRLALSCSSLGPLLAGCAAFSGYPTNYQDNTAVITADQPYLSADVRTRENSSDAKDRGDLTPQQYRDAVVYRRIEVIDINYYDFEAKLVGTYDALSLGADLTTLVLNGIGATTGSLTTAAALAAASAGVIGANAAVNTDIFYRKTIPALVAQMRASRQTALVTIKTGLKKAVADYSLDEALGDINTYYVAGTLPSAIAQVTSKAGAELSAADAQLAALRSIPFAAAAPGSSMERIFVWLYPPDGNEKNAVVDKNRTDITNWKDTDNVDPVLRNIPLEIWLRDTSSATENARQRAIAKLKIPEVKR
jgi:hypothetical protein